MKKSFVGALVGGLIIFLWQFLSFALINFHQPAQKYTDKQDAIMGFLDSQGLEEGGYVLPNVPEGTSMDEHERLMKDAIGKPWASIQYHKMAEDDMVMNVIRGFVVDFIIVLLFCWLAGKMTLPSGGTIFMSTLVTGLIVFLNAHYTHNIWYDTFDVWFHLLDAVVSWGIVGLWLAWWLRKGREDNTRYRVADNQRQVA